MREQRSSGSSAHEVACRWLKQNTPRWKTWIPNPTSCNLGFGLYDEQSEEFVGSRSLATTCKACIPGTFSSLLVDTISRTYVCLTCEAGTEQFGAGEVSCQSCPAGKFKAFQSREECALCARSFYQDEMGALGCKKCPEGTTTLLLGAKKLSQCVCSAGSIDVANEDSQAQRCELCQKGLSCPEGSTVELLKLGEQALTSRNLDKVPAIMSGYFSWAERPLETFKCTSVHCIGGTPGTCEGGALGPTCDSCPEGMYWENGMCSDCSVSLKALWVGLMSLFVPFLALMYYYTETGYTASPSLTECARMALDLMLNILQNLGILSFVPIEWPEGLRKLLEFSQVFVLNLKSSVNCISINDFEHYLVLAAGFFGVAVILPGLGCLTHSLSCLTRRGLSWEYYRTICVIGKIYQSLFVSMCSVGLSPFMCYSHPNGEHSVLKYPNILCNSPEHGMMQLSGAAVLILALSHFVLCSWASHLAPNWSINAPGRLGIIAFLMANFQPSSWWFGLVVLVRGVLLSLGQVLTPDDQGLQLLIMMFVLCASMCLQLWFLPWKLPLLNLVDALSTFFLLGLLAIAMQVSMVENAELLDALGSALFFLSLAVIVAVGFFSLGLVAVQHLCKRKGVVAVGLRVMALGKPADPTEMLMIFMGMASNLECKSEVAQKRLARTWMGKVVTYNRYCFQDEMI